MSEAGNGITSRIMPGEPAALAISAPGETR